MTTVAPTFRAAVAKDDGGAPASSLLINKPTGTAEGDLLVLAFTIGSELVPILPAGFVRVRSDETGPALGDFEQHVYAKRAAASEPADYLVEWSGGSGPHDAILAAYYHAHQGTPAIEAHGGSASAAADTSTVAPSVTISRQPSRVIRIWQAGQATLTVPGGVTVRASTTGTVLVLADELVSATGATGTSTATHASTAHRIGQTLALEPEVLLVQRWGVVPI